MRTHSPGFRKSHQNLEQTKESHNELIQAKPRIYNMKCFVSAMHHLSNLRGTMGRAKFFMRSINTNTPTENASSTLVNRDQTHIISHRLMNLNIFSPIFLFKLIELTSFILHFAYSYAYDEQSLI